MVSILHFGFVILVGLLSMAITHAAVAVGRELLTPDSVRNYYAGIGIVLVVAGGVMVVASPTPTTATGLLVSFGGWLAMTLGALYGAVAVKAARADDDGGEPRSEEPDGEHDRPLLE